MPTDRSQWPAERGAYNQIKEECRFGNQVGWFLKVKLACCTIKGQVHLFRIKYLQTDGSWYKRFHLYIYLYIYLQGWLEMFGQSFAVKNQRALKKGYVY